MGGASWIQEKETGTFEPAEAYILKGPGATHNYTFAGTPHDGDINAVINSSHFSLLGNPYPSSLSAQEFFSDNSDVIQTLYFWQHTGSGNNHTQSEYEGGYSTLVGTVSAAATAVTGTAGLSEGYDYNTISPKAHIAVGQGFFVRATPSGGTINFNNSQRSSLGIGDSSIFLKGSKHQKKEAQVTQTLPLIKVGFDYINESGLDLHRQIAVSFKEGNSYESDNGYDALIYDLNSTDAYFQFEDYREKYVIAGIEAWNPSLEIPFTISMNYDGVSYLMLDSVENIDHAIYLEDKETNTITNLGTGSVQLNLNSGTYTDRFYLIFGEEQTLAKDTTTSKTVLVRYDKNSKQLVLKKEMEIEINSIRLVNTVGQTVNSWQEKDILNVKQTAQGVYYLILDTSIGKITKKIAIY